MTEASTSRAASTDQLSQALGLLQQALADLDASGAPGDIGAHVDHAIVRLQAVLLESPIQFNE